MYFLFLHFITCFCLRMKLHVITDNNNDRSMRRSIVIHANTSLAWSKLLFQPTDNKYNFVIFFSVACFGAIHIGKQHNKLQPDVSKYQPNAGEVSLYSYGYGTHDNGCTWPANSCGPNYCCCKAFNSWTNKQTP